MASPLSADALISALRAEGVKTVEVPGWRTNNRNHVGAWGPVNGVMIHHTVTSGTAGTVALCFDGRSDLPGPLCHGVIAKDGTVHLVGNGRANHAGSGDDDVLKAVIAESTTLPAPDERNTDGNAHFYGFECINLGDGVDPWPEVQLEAMVRASAALCRAHGWNARSVIGHKEWTNQKIDPRGFTMTEFRARVAARLSSNPEDDMTVTDAEIRAIGRQVVTGANGMKSPDDPTVEWAVSSYLGRTYVATRRLEAVAAEIKAQAQANGAALTEIRTILAALDLSGLPEAVEAKLTSLRVKLEEQA